MDVGQAMDVNLLEVLAQADCLEHYRHFLGLTKNKLTGMSFKILNSKLQEVLQPIEVHSRSVMIKKIKAVISKYDDEDKNSQLMDIEMLNWLSGCQEIKSYHHFKDRSKISLTDLSITELNTELRSILKDDPNRERIVGNLLMQLSNDDDGGDNGATVDVKQEQEADSSTGHGSAPQFQDVAIDIKLGVDVKVENGSGMKHEIIDIHIDDDEVKIIEVKDKGIPPMMLIDDDGIEESQDTSALNVDNSGAEISAEPLQDQEDDAGHDNDDSALNMDSTSVLNPPEQYHQEDDADLENISLAEVGEIENALDVAVAPTTTACREPNRKRQRLASVEGDSNAAGAPSPTPTVTLTTKRKIKRKTSVPPPTITSGRASQRHANSQRSSPVERYAGPIRFHPTDRTMSLLDSSTPPYHVKLCSKPGALAWKRWKQLFSEYGAKIESLDLIKWTWKPNKAKCQANLAFILAQVCPQLKQLSILSECYEPPSPEVSPPLNLKNLTILKIDHDGNLDYHQELGLIIKGTNGNLQKIEFSYLDEFAMNRFLDILETLEPHELTNLKTLSLQKRDGEHFALAGREIELIANIKANRLEELDLGFGFWDDAQHELEAVLANFPGLKIFKAHGSFITTQKVEPKLVINFPRMDNLEVLDMGGNYSFASVIESLNERPAKRKSKMAILNENEAGPSSAPALSQGVADDQVETTGVYFSVTLILPELPALKTLILGSSYDVSDIHFARMPHLEVFRVASAWHIAVSFPRRISRRMTYYNLKELQLPDFFEDYSFLPQIPKHFPALEKCYINLPTIKVLRRFAKVMQNVESFKHLELKVQFDFESSLNLCFMEHPCLQVQSPWELRQINVLKEYAHWERYVQLNQIQVPEMEEEDAESYAGLHVFKDKLASFEIVHVPRKLRLPKGSLDWNHDECEFSDVLIGFGEQEYPLSQLVFDALPQNARFLLFDHLSNIESKMLQSFYFKKPEHSCELDASIMTVETKMERVGMECNRNPGGLRTSSSMRSQFAPMVNPITPIQVVTLD